MKKLVLSVLLIFGLAATNHGKPINFIYSLDDPIAIEEESYIDDIPFNTWQVAVDALVSGDELKLEDEPYINDIPFDTKAIAGEYLLRKIEKNSAESSVNDIPFNTEKVMYEELSSRLTEVYRQEQNTNDLPCEALSRKKADHGDTYYIPASRENGERRYSDRQKKMELRYFQPIIYPVKLDVTRIKMKNEPIDAPLIASPSSSL